MFVARCPTCATELDVAEADRGHPVVCPECRERFVAQPKPAPPPPADVEAKRGGVSRHWHDDSDYVNETAIPPRHWLEREEDRGPNRGRDPYRMARRLLLVPANGLTWTGWIGFLVMIIGGFFTAVTGYLDLTGRHRVSEGPIFRLAGGAVAGTLGSMFFAMIATGGGRMKRVRKRGSAVTTAVMGLLTLLTCTPLFPLAWFAAGFGLWALIVLNRPEVVDAFERRKVKG